MLPKCFELASELTSQFEVMHLDEDPRIYLCGAQELQPNAQQISIRRHRHRRD